jgi:hypothetical protein
MVAVAAAVLALAPLGAASAQSGKGKGSPPKRADEPVVNSWALAPTGRNPAEPSSRVYLSYNIAPGSTLKDSVTLWNYSNVQLTFQVYATDAFNNPKGAFELLPAAKRPTDAGTWVTLPQPNITAAAHTKIDLPFTLTVPANARPGDHAGAILAANAVTGTGPDGKTVTVDRRTGSRMYIRVAGPVQPSLVVENVRTVYHPALNPLGGSTDVTYTVRNSGNVRLAAHQQVAASAPFGIARKVHKPADVPELLPQNAITLHEHYTGSPALLRANADIQLQPFSPSPDVQVKALRRGGHTWAMPWSIIAVLLIVWLARRSYRAMQQRRHDVCGRPPPQPDRLAPVP